MDAIDVVIQLMTKFLDDRVLDGSIRQYLRNGDVFTIAPFQTQEKVFLELKNMLRDEKNDLILRQLIWLNHGCDFKSLYGDDGEMQCGKCMIDFKRDPAESIRDRLVARGRKIVEAEITAAGGWDNFKKVVEKDKHVLDVSPEPKEE
jgi:hypothetical protein